MGNNKVWLAWIVIPIMMIKIHVAVVYGGDQFYCPPLRPSQTLTFSKAPATMAIACYHQYVDLSCCMSGATHITWQAEAGDNKNIWEVEEGNSNQTLIIKRAEQAWNFTCIGKNGSSDMVLENTISLRIENCTTYTKAPDLILPTSNVLLKRLDTQVNLPCKGFYGPIVRPDQGYSSIDWEYTKRDGEFASLVSNNATDRVYYTQTDRVLQSNGMEAVLHIKRVQEEDYRKYKCVLINKNGNTEYTVYIRHGDDTVWMHDPAFQAVMAVLCSIIVVTILVGLLVWKCRVNIKLMYKDKFKKHDPSDEKDFDVLIVYNDNKDSDDVKFVKEKLLPHLEKQLGYKACWPERDFVSLEGQGRVPKCIPEAVSKSHCVMFIISAAILENNYGKQVWDSSIEKSHQNILFVIREPILDDIWQKAVKGGTKIDWPIDTKSKREKNIWKKIRLALPPLPVKPDSETGQNRSGSWRSSRSSQRPLLSSGRTTDVPQTEDGIERNEEGQDDDVFIDTGNQLEREDSAIGRSVSQ